MSAGVPAWKGFVIYPEAPHECGRPRYGERGALWRCPECGQHWRRGASFDGDLCWKPCSRRRALRMIRRWRRGGER